MHLLNLRQASYLGWLTNGWRSWQSRIIESSTDNCAVTGKCFKKRSLSFVLRGLTFVYLSDGSRLLLLLCISTVNCAVTGKCFKKRSLSSVTRGVTFVYLSYESRSLLLSTWKYLRISSERFLGIAWLMASFCASREHSHYMCLSGRTA